MRKIKEKLKHAFPVLVGLGERLSMFRIFVRYYALIVYYRIRFPGKSIFNVIYDNQAWGTDSVSGGGSTLNQTTSVRIMLPKLFRELKIDTVVDAPCGDYLWMDRTSLDVKCYIGIDIVPDLIKSNQEKYSNEKVEFQCADITKDKLPQVDIIICRDCLVHFSNRNIKKALCTFKSSNSKYLLTTTYPGLAKHNWNIVTGMWRPVDLQKPPFNLPEPLAILNEHCTENTDYKEKSLGLWKIDDIPV